MASSESKQKRFIAGAICPRCGSVDKIYTLTEMLSDVHSGSKGVSRHCFDCDFSEDLESAQKELEPSEIQIIKLPGT